MYNSKYERLFIKIGNWAILWLHKSFLIFIVTGVIIKLTEQYMDPFLIKEKIVYLAYKLDILSN